MEGAIAGLPLRDAPASKRTKIGDLVVQALGAVVWGIFFCVAPIFEVLVLGAVLWIPVLIWRERCRTRKFGFLPGFIVRLAIVAGMVTAAVLLPTKHEDKLVEGFTTTKVTLEEIGKHTRVFIPADEAATTIVLPSTKPSLREVIGAIESQTELRCNVARCGNCVSLYAGAYIISISVRKPG